MRVTQALVALTLGVGVSASPTQSSALSSGSYDYIVVGGGPSGIIAATRLAQANKKVLLLERGVGPTVETGATGSLSWNDTLTPVDVPALASALSDIGLFSKYACDDTQGMAACVLGGGGTFNYMVYVHPPARDFDDKWPTGWKWKNIKAAAERVYRVNPGTNLPSKDGKRYDQGMYTSVSKFLGSLGWKSVDQVKQPNEKTKVYSYPNWDVGKQIRVGPIRTYLPAVEKSNNFELRLNSKVTRVVRSGSKATGVEISTANGTETVNLAKNGRVVLAAGTYGSPRILFNSGIGPTEQLQVVAKGTSGITLPSEKEWINLPVGQGLKDHSIFTFTIKTSDDFAPYNTTAVTAQAASSKSDIELYEQGSGVLSQGMHRLIFWTSNVASDGVTRYFQGSCSATGQGEFKIKAYMTHGLTSSGSIGIDSTGKTVTLSSPYLQTQGDKDSAEKFVTEMAASISNYAGYQLVGYTNSSAVIAGATSGNHVVGTAVIGQDKKTSVVDTNAKVHGTDNLYVVDASIHADLPSGNSQAIVMVVAEAAAAKILAAR